MISHPATTCLPDQCGREPDEGAIADLGRYHHRFRQSWLNSVMLCPERGRLIAIEKLPYDAADSAAIGTGVHAGIEANLKGLVSTPEEAFPLMEEAFWEEERQPGFKYVKYSNRQAMKLMAMYYEQWHNHFIPHYRNQRGWELEQRFLFTLVDDHHRIIEISGTYDAFDGFTLYDWKTSGRGEYEAREYQRWAIQPTVYTKAVYEATGYNPTFQYVVMHEDGLQTFDCIRHEDDWDWLAEQCDGLAIMIESDLPVWPKNDQHWLCAKRWCPAWSDCKGKHHRG